MGKQKIFNGFSDEEDSHNYLDDESEVMTAEDEVEIYEYSFRDRLVEFMNSKFVVIGLISGALLALAFMFWKTNIILIVYDTKEEINRSLGICLLVLASVLVGMLLTEFGVRQLSLMWLKKGKGDGDLWYHMNELSSHISVMIALLFLLFFFSFTIGNFYIKRICSIPLNSNDFLRISMITTLLFAIQNVIVKNISMSFNYNIYMNRIKKCILFDFFINLISTINDTDIINNITENPETQSENEKFTTTVIFQRRFHDKDLSNISLGAKRLLLKEFQAVVKNSIYSGSLPTILGKIRAIASAKADKLVRKLKRTNKIEKIADLGRHFPNLHLFDYVLKGIDLSKDETLTRSNMFRFLEKAFRERYVVYKSIEQVNAAIGKLALCAKIVICVFAIFACYISSDSASDNLILGGFSTLISGHIFNRIVSDHVINSAIFLFIIRPFDIGDRVKFILNGIEENLVVSELNVFSTQFYRWDGTLVFIPNHILHSNPITNVRRSGATMETHSIQINSSTDPTKLFVLKQMLYEFVKTNKEVYTDYILVNYEKIENSNKLFIKVLVQYQTNCQNHESYLKKRSYFILELNRCLKTLGITYNLPPRNIQLSTINNNDILKTAKII